MIDVDRNRSKTLENMHVPIARTDVRRSCSPLVDFRTVMMEFLVRSKLAARMGVMSRNIHVTTLEKLRRTGFDSSALHPHEMSAE